MASLCYARVFKNSFSYNRQKNRLELLEYFFGRLNPFNGGQTQSGPEERLKNTITSSCVVEDDMAYMDNIEEL